MSCPVLLTQHKKLRKDFVNKSITMDFECKNVAFSNEKKLDEPIVLDIFGLTFVRTKPNDNLLATLPFSQDGMTAESYVEMFAKNLPPEVSLETICKNGKLRPYTFRSLLNHGLKQNL